MTDSRTLLDLIRREPDRFDAVFLDIDGTVLLGNQMIPHAPDLIRELRDRRIPFRYLTNNTSQDHQALADRMNRAGVPAEPDDFIRASDPWIPFIRDWNKTGRELRFFLIGKLPEDPGNVVFEKDPEKIFSCDGVCHAGGTHDWQTDLIAVLNFFLEHPDRPFFVPNPDTMNPMERGMHICPRGQCELVIMMLAKCGIQKDMIFIGKPYAPVYQYALKKLGLSASKRILCAGDFLSSDIAGANRMGLCSALVLTGMDSREKAEKASPDQKPDLIFDSI